MSQGRTVKISRVPLYDVPDNKEWTMKLRPTQQIVGVGQRTFRTPDALGLPTGIIDVFVVEEAPNADAEDKK